MARRLFPAVREGRRAIELGAHFALALLTPRFPLFWLRGVARASGRPATILVAGRAPWVDYLPSTFFASEPAREPIGRASMWTLPGRLRRLRTSADLTVVRVDRISQRLFRRGEYLRVPEWVGTVLEVPDDPAAYIRRSRSRKEDLRQVRRNGLTPALSHDVADVEAFYDSMYRPYTRRRHGDLAFLARRGSFRRWLRGGGLLWIEREGQRLAGLLYRVSHPTMYLAAVGTATGDPEPRDLGALAATYIYGIEVARRLGCVRMDYGGSRPSLRDGVLRYKRKWGIELNEKQNGHFDHLVRWSRLDADVVGFLSRASPIFREGDRLSALHVLDLQRVADAEDMAEARASAWIGGLQRLYVFNAEGWSGVDPVPPDVRLLDPAALSAMTGF